MTFPMILAILITVTAAASFLNQRFLKLPQSIGLTTITLLAAMLFVWLDHIHVIPEHQTANFLKAIDFNTTFLGGMISFLLFAGAVQLSAIEMARHKQKITILGLLGVLISTTIIGVLIYGFAILFHIPLSFYDALIFGAIIAPTDPIAVLGVLKRIKLPKTLELIISGEALFNDGIGIVLFVTLIQLSAGHAKPDTPAIAFLFVRQLIGGLLVGAGLGVFTTWLLKQVDNYGTQVLITLALVTGGYYFALSLNVSGPIAMAIAGLIVGDHLEKSKLSQQLSELWKLIDEVLNAILFVLIGLAVSELTFTANGIIVALSAIPICLFGRWVSVKIPMKMFKQFKRIGTHATTLLTWGGLRGGISIALALSLPASQSRDEILAATYAVVVFSLLVQGLTLGPMLRKMMQPSGIPAAKRR